MEINCDGLVERYLLLKNPFYAFNFPIAILVAIIVYGFAVSNKFSNNSYINQIIIPIVALLLTMVIIDIVSKALISNEKKSRLSKLCSSWLNDPNNKGKMLSDGNLNMFEVENYSGQIENFSSNGNIQESNEISVNNLIDENIEMGNNQIVDNVNTKFIKRKRSDITGVNPAFTSNMITPLPANEITCVGDDQSNECNLCSGMGENPNNLVAPIPGPQWLPQTAESVQNRMVKKHYTANKCVGEPPYRN